MSSLSGIPKCADHDSPCNVKVGLKDGPNKGKVFFICSAPHSPCSFSAPAPAEYAPPRCPSHPESACGLVRYSLSASPGGVAAEYRCSQHPKSQSWCGLKRFHAMQDALAAHRPASTATAGTSAETRTRPESQSPRSSESVDVLSSALATMSLSAAPSRAASLEDQFAQSLTLADAPRASSYDPSIPLQLAEIAKQLEKQTAFMESSLFKTFPANIKAKAAATKQSLLAQHQQLQQAEVAQAHMKAGFALQKAQEAARREREQQARQEEQARLQLLQTLNGAIQSARQTSKGILPEIDAAQSISEKDLSLLNELAAESGRLKQATSSLPSPKPALLASSLMQHQVKALEWMLWRESNPSSLCCGGILADDMGLGKTVSIIALICHSKQQPQQQGTTRKDDLVSPATLIVCPSSVLLQWQSELDRHVVGSGLKVHVYHGGSRNKSASLFADLSSADVVLTTYGLVEMEQRSSARSQEKAAAGAAAPSSSVSESSEPSRGLSPIAVAKANAAKQQKAPPASASEGNNSSSSSSSAKSDHPLHSIMWNRIVLDEGHVIRNSVGQTCLAVCSLRARARWLVSGTLVHNSSEDLNSCFRFLRALPFCSRKVWSGIMTSSSTASKASLVDNRTSAGKALMDLLVQALVLRRVKTQVDSNNKPIVVLPRREFMTHSVLLGPEESELYQTLNAQATKILKLILKGKADAEQKTNLLVRILKLRQLTCHPALLSAAGVEESGVREKDGSDSGSSGEEDEESDASDSEGEGEGKGEGSDISAAGNERASRRHGPKATTDDSDIASLFSTLKISNADEDAVRRTEASLGQELLRGFAGNQRLQALFRPQFESSKLATTVRLVRDIVHTKKCKAVIVSQWTRLLDIVASHLTSNKISFARVDGRMTPARRQKEVAAFFGNWTADTALRQQQGLDSGGADATPHISGASVLLLSLTAGGVGLNLVAANHLIVLDSHWNPALEDQAFDRVYRVGQPLPVFVHKLVCKASIEERVLELQMKKRAVSQDLVDRNVASASSGGQESEGARGKIQTRLSLEELARLLQAGAD